MDGYLVSLDGSCAPVTRPAAEAALRAETLLWLDLRGVDADTDDMLRDVFAFHPLALRDAGKSGQRPRAETIGNLLYLVATAATTVGGPLSEVHIFVAPEFLITVCLKDCGTLDDVRRDTADSGPAAMPARRARLHMLHEILTAVNGSFFGPLSDLDDQIDALIERIFARPSQDELAELLSMQRWLVMVRKMVSPQRDAVSAVLSGAVDLPGRA